MVGNNLSMNYIQQAAVIVGGEGPTIPPAIGLADYWFDAQQVDDVLLAGVPAQENDPVDEWRNRNNPAQSLLQETAADRPQLTIINGVRGITGDGVSAYMADTTLLDWWQTEFFLVVRHVVTGQHQSLVSFGHTFNGRPYINWRNTDETESYIGTGLFFSSQAAVLGSLYLHRCKFSPLDGTGENFWNGSSTPDPALTNGQQIMRELQILARNNNQVNPGQSAICELIMREGYFTAQESADITAYLLSKYLEIMPQP